MACFPNFVWEEGRYIFSNHCDVIDVHSAEYGPLIVKIPRSNNYELEHEAATLEYFSGIGLGTLTPEVVFWDNTKLDASVTGNTSKSDTVTTAV